MNVKDAWKQLAVKRTELLEYNPLQGDKECSAAVRRYLDKSAKTASLFVEAAKLMDNRDFEEKIGEALTANNKGILFELLALGLLGTRGIRATCPASIQSTDTYSKNNNTTISLDGKLYHCDVLFDIKTLANPEVITQRLIKSVNKELSKKKLHAVASGALDYQHSAMEKGQFSKIKEYILKQASARSQIDIPDHPLKIQIYEAGQLTLAENGFMGYRYAENNRLLAVKDAHQIPRNQKFVLIFVYERSEHEFGTFPKESLECERAFARRVFIELTKWNSVDASEYSSKVDANVKVADVAKSIGAIFFAMLDYTDQAEDTLRAYLNPNANPHQKVAEWHLKSMADFNNNVFEQIDDFKHDNY